MDRLHRLQHAALRHTRQQQHRHPTAHALFALPAPQQYAHARQLREDDVDDGHPHHGHVLLLRDDGADFHLPNHHGHAARGLDFRFRRRTAHGVGRL